MLEQGPLRGSFRTALTHATVPPVGACAPSEARSHARHDGVRRVLQLADNVRHHGREQPQLRLRCTNVLSMVLSSSSRAHDGRAHLGPIFLCGMASSARGTTAAPAEASFAAANFTCASASSCGGLLSVSLRFIRVLVTYAYRLEARGAPDTRSCVQGCDSDASSRVCPRRE